MEPEILHSLPLVLVICGLMLAVAALGTRMATRVGIPTALAFIAVGMVIGGQTDLRKVLVGYEAAYAVGNVALALILFMLVLPLPLFFLTPLSSAWSRRQEFQADAYATQHAQAQDLRSALLKLYRDNASTLTPDPVYVAFYYSHPPASQRIARIAA